MSPRDAAIVFGVIGLVLGAVLMNAAWCLWLDDRSAAPSIGSPQQPFTAGESRRCDNCGDEVRWHVGRQAWIHGSGAGWCFPDLLASPSEGNPT